MEQSTWGLCQQRSVGAMFPFPRQLNFIYFVYDLGEWNRSDFGIVKISIQANVASYDWSALLYLSSVGKDFEGVAGKTRGKSWMWLLFVLIRLDVNCGLSFLDAQGKAFQQK